MMDTKEKMESNYWMKRRMDTEESDMFADNN
jgi:hypothetical protein